MWTAEQYVNAIVLVAGALGLRELLPGLVQAFTGREKRAREDRKELEQDRADALRGEERERCLRRIYQDHASELRGRMLQAGVQDMPPWPEAKDCGDNPSSG